VFLWALQRAAGAEGEVSAGGTCIIPPVPSRVPAPFLHLGCVLQLTWEDWSTC